MAWGVRIFIVFILSALVGIGMAPIFRMPRPHVSAPPPAPAPLDSTVPAPGAAPVSAPGLRPLRPEIAKMPALKRLSAVFDTRDIPRTARHLLDAIAELTREDFEAIRNGKKQLSDLKNYGFDQPFQMAMMRSLVERWLAVDEAHAMAFLPDLAKKSKSDDIGEMLLGAFLAARPRESIKSLLAMPPEDNVGPISNAIRSAFAALTGKDADAARASLSECRTDGQRKSAELGIVAGLAVNDPLAAATQASRLNSEEGFREALAAAESVGPGAIIQVLSAASKEFVESYDIGRLALLYPEAAWDTLPADLTAAPEGIELRVIEEAQLVNPAKRASLLERSATFPDYLKTQVRSALLKAWAAESPKDAIDWGMRNASASGGKDTAPLSFAFWGWMTQDREAALAWWNALPSSPVRDALAPAASRPPITGEPPAPEAEAARLLANTDEGSRWSFSRAVSQWVAADAAAAAQWVESQPPGASRDRASHAYAAAVAPRDPVAAREWIASIGDRNIRQQAVESTLYSMFPDDPASAREWISNLTDVNPLWKQWMLRTR